MQGNQNVAGLYDHNTDAANNLKLELLNPDSTHPGQTPDMVFDEQGGVIGRGSNCDWILRCTRRLISRRHAIISYLDGQYYIQDASSNGIMLNDSSEPIPQGMCTPLQEGDIFFIGDLSIGVSLVTADSQSFDNPVDLHAIEAPVHADPLPVSDSHAVSPERSMVHEADEDIGRIARQAAELGRPDDHFEPPKALIPDNWDLDVSAHSKTPSDVVERPSAPSFAEKNSITGALFAGMGLSGKGVDSLTPETMELLGKCLRISIEGLAKLREGHSDIENALLQEKILQNDASAEKMSAIEPFINGCMSSDKKKGENLVSQLKTDYLDLIGQQAAIIDCLGKVSGIVAEQFNPERIENAFRRFQEHKAKKRPWYGIFSRNNLKTTYREFFQVYYKLRRRETDRSLKCIFDQRFLVFYSGRLRGKK